MLEQIEARCRAEDCLWPLAGFRSAMLLTCLTSREGRAAVTWKSLFKRKATACLISEQAKARQHCRCPMRAQRLGGGQVSSDRLTKGKQRARCKGLPVQRMVTNGCWRAMSPSGDCIARPSDKPVVHRCYNTSAMAVSAAGLEKQSEFERSQEMQ